MTSVDEFPALRSQTATSNTGRMDCRAALAMTTSPFVFDSSKPDSTLRKLLDVSRMEQLGWQAKTGLRAGIEQAYADFLATFSGGTADVFDSGVLRP